ncbi:CHASE2 domain-containing protein [Trichormus azollae HNT15244]
MDARILLVSITQEDLMREQWPLSDQTINKLVQKLASYQPRVIGLNIYGHQQQNLAPNLQNQIIGTCLLSNIGRLEVPLPPDFTLENVGFDDVVTENSTDQAIRSC